MTALPTHSGSELAAADFAQLTARPKSELAVKLCDILAGKLFHQRRKGPTRLQCEAFGIFIADLLERDPSDNGGWLYRGLSPGSFTGEAIGYRRFRLLIEHMDGLMIEVAKGTRQYVQSELTGGRRQHLYDRATRFRATSWLRDWFEAEGITRDNWDEHFERSRPTNAIQQLPLALRSAASRRFNGPSFSRSLPFDLKDAQIREMIDRMTRLNDYLARQATEPFGPVFLRRIFTRDDQKEFQWDNGGRLYTLGTETYMTAKKEVRSKITINGEPVAELDIRASHLTLLVGMGHLPPSVLEGDPYFVDGLPREIVKQWVNMTISHGRRHKRWPRKAKEELEETHGWNLSTDFPLRETGDRILEKLPLVGEDGETSLAGWGRLQFVESEIILKTMEDLAFQHQVPSLPVHDSIIVPSSKAELAIMTLKENFRTIGGIEPMVA